MHRGDFRRCAYGALALFVGFCCSTPARAQSQFGGQARADAAASAIVLAVQQGISSLPPTSGQSFTYEFDPKLDAYTASPALGPTVLRSPQTVGAGKLSFRGAATYFAIDQTLGPILYREDFD